MRGLLGPAHIKEISTGTIYLIKQFHVRIYFSVGSTHGIGTPVIYLTNITKNYSLATGTTEPDPESSPPSKQYYKNYFNT